jgi:hypothetical protein
MLISGDINSKRRTSNICTRILQYVHNFFFQIDELSMKVTKTIIKSYKFSNEPEIVFWASDLVNIWLLSAFTDSVSCPIIVHLWNFEQC